MFAILAVLGKALVSVPVGSRKRRYRSQQIDSDFEAQVCNPSHRPGEVGEIYRREYARTTISIERSCKGLR
jgi:hypothetical protein